MDATIFLKLAQAEATKEATGMGIMGGLKKRLMGGMGQGMGAKKMPAAGMGRSDMMGQRRRTGLGAGQPTG